MDWVFSYFWFLVDKKRPHPALSSQKHWEKTADIGGWKGE
jgi:hypothetical protein